MYKAIKLGDAIDRQKLQRIITIEFNNGTSSFVKDYPFQMQATDANIKRRIQNELDVMNSEVKAIPDGELDLTIEPDTTAEPVKTAAQLAREEWEIDRERLRTLMELVRDGALPADFPQVVALQTKVRTNIKAAYIA